jgi:hypothetical protein
MTAPEPAVVSIRISRYPGDENPRTVENVHDFDISENGHVCIDYGRTEVHFDRIVYAPSGWSDIEITGIPNPKPKPAHEDKPGRGPRR